MSKFSKIHFTIIIAVRCESLKSFKPLWNSGGVVPNPKTCCRSGAWGANRKCESVSGMFIFSRLLSTLVCLLNNELWINNLLRLGGRHLVDIIGGFSWTKGVTSSGHFWWLLVYTFVHEKSSFGVNFRGHFLGEFSWTFWVNFCGHLIVMISSSNKLTQT